MSSPYDDVKVQDAYDFIISDILEEPWIIENVIVSGGRTLFWGDTGIGKSRVLFSLIKSLLTGEPFLSMAVPPRENRVYYICADMPEQDAKRLLTACFPDAENERWLKEGRWRIYYSRNNIDLLDPGEYAFLKESIRDFDPTVVIADTLSGICDPLLVNQSGTAKKFYDLWNDLVGPTVGSLFSHHEKKPQQQQGFNVKPLSGKALFSGDQGWLNYASIGMQLYKAGGGLYLKGHKVRGLEWSKRLRQATDSLLWVEDVSEVELAMRSMIQAGKPKAAIVAAITDKGVWNGQAMSSATAYRRIQEYEDSISHRGV